VIRRLTAGLGALALATALIAAACGDDEEYTSSSASSASSASSTGAPGSVTLKAGDFFFQPTSLTAAPGQTLTVRVKNEGATAHTFTIDDLGVDTVIPAGEEKEVEVNAAGHDSLSFYCRFHPSRMTGTITAGEGSAPAPTGDSSRGGYYGY